MLANLVCWIIALALILSDTHGARDLYIRLGFAMGFILLGTLSKAVDVYHETHKKENKRSESDLTIVNNQL